jgi:hypothetical protein
VRGSAGVLGKKAVRGDGGSQVYGHLVRWRRLQPVGHVTGRVLRRKVSGAGGVVEQVGRTVIILVAVALAAQSAALLLPLLSLG